MWLRFPTYNLARRIQDRIKRRFHGGENSRFMASPSIARFACACQKKGLANARESHRPARLDDRRYRRTRELTVVPAQPKPSLSSQATGFAEDTQSWATHADPPRRLRSVDRGGRADRNVTMRNRRSRRSAHINTKNPTARLEQLAEESCAECFAGDCGTRRPCCCEMVEYLALDDRGRYFCARCNFLGSPRQLEAKLLREGRIL